MGVIGLLKKTILPFIFSEPNAIISSIPRTSITDAFKPFFGVATELPNAQIGTSIFFPLFSM